MTRDQVGEDEIGQFGRDLRPLGLRGAQVRPAGHERLQCLGDRSLVQGLGVA